MMKKIVAIVTIIITLIVVISFIVFAITESRPPYQLEAFTKNFNLNAKDQVFCLENATGTIAEYNQDKLIIPASISKLYTFDFALAKLGKDFRYTTDLFLNENTLYINGGGDPHFVIENLNSVFKKIGTDFNNLIFSKGFYMNWQQDHASVTRELGYSLNQHKVKANVQYSENAYSGPGTHYQYQSAPLSILIKQINDYSTNISADILFKRAGGSDEFSKYMKGTYGVDENFVKLGTGSGLSDNYTTCELTLKVIKHIESITKDIGVQNVMSIPRVDPGALKKTLESMATTSGIVAKSGYLDYHRNLAGITYTTSGPIYFAVFGTYKNLEDDLKTKKFVEGFLGSLLAPYVQIPFKYYPQNDKEVPRNNRILKMRD